MSAWRAVLVFLCLVLAPGSARRTDPELEEVVEKINSARCTSRCLTLHMTQLTAAFKHLQNDQVLVWCENHRRCSQCLQPCKELWETRKALPQKSCEKQTECFTSREFLASLKSSRQGDCPPPQRAMGFAAACVESCSLDQHCLAPRKCCSNGCGHTCQAPANLYKGVPLKPRRDMSFLEDAEGRVEVAWVSKFNVSVEPVVYLLQSRWNTGIHPSEDHASPWNTVAMTLSERAVVSDLRPQRWFQFRVAAINSHGSRGFTTPSKHYITNRDPSPPEAPHSIRVANQTLAWQESRVMDGSRVTVDGVRVGVLVVWDPHRDGDLPVHHYRVTWAPRHTHTAHGHTHTPLRNTHAELRQTYTQNGLTHTAHGHTHTPHGKTHTRHRHTTHINAYTLLEPAAGQNKKESNNRITHGAQCELWLQGLLPATTYFLSVQTVAYWGQKRLKSPRTQAIFTTVADTVLPSLPDSKGGDYSNELPSSLSSPSLADPVPHPDPAPNPVTQGNLRLVAAAPHYHDNQLQVKMFWKRRRQASQPASGVYQLKWRPHSCTTNVTDTENTATVQGTHYTITGLMFSCKYRVSMATEGDLESEVVAWVTTPACTNVRVRGGKDMPCGTEERPLSGRKVLLRPERLTADHQQVNGSLITTFRWRLSHNAPGQPAIEGFQFTWTQLAPPTEVTMPTEGQEDALISQTQIVAPNQRSLMVSGLHGDNDYQLQLQVLTAGGSGGASVSRTIHTPAVQL